MTSIKFVLKALPLFVFSFVALIGCDKASSEGAKPSTPAPKDAKVFVPDELKAMLAETEAKPGSPRQGVVEQRKKDADDEDGVREKEETPKGNPFVRGAEMGGLQAIGIELSGVPDLNKFMDYVEISPKPGPCTTDYYSWRKSVEVSAEFKPRTTYRLTVRAGLPMADGSKTVEEFRRTFTTGDRSQDVEFAARGRYLPPAGMRAIAVKTMNVTNLMCQIRSVPRGNVVQLLAREEDCYGRFYGGGGDSRDTVEISTEPITRTMRLPVRLNEEVVTPIPVRDEDGVSANGVYLVSACAAKDKRDADDNDVNRAVYRLVCLTDIGLSVREAGGSVYVWATSLTKGTPIPELLVSVYSSANVLMGEGITDAEGWCCCEMPEAGKPFAVVASKKNGGDMSFLALRKPLDETIEQGTRRRYVARNGSSEAFVWTDRGIYRHNEKILVHALARDRWGNAPKPLPLTVELSDPDGKVFSRATRVTDAQGALVVDTFAVADDQKSGWWTIDVQTPGDDPFVLGSRRIKIEEFVPPQVRVKVEMGTGIWATNVTMTVGAEHLFGGPAKGLMASAAVMFTDEPFAPKGWEQFRFGDENRRLPPNFTEFDRKPLDAEGRMVWDEPRDAFPACEGPRAAVKVTAQGAVFENGGRPAIGRTTRIVHYYPYYIGVMLPDVLRRSPKPQACRVVLVNPDGTPCLGARRLVARFERIEFVYGLKKNDNGFFEWLSDKMRYPMGEDVPVEVAANGTATLNVPVSSSGDFAVTLFEKETKVSFGASYWVGSGADDSAVRTSLATPSHVTLVPDKPLYHPGDVPRLSVKAPFKGTAWLEVLNEDMVYSQIIVLTNATSEVLLEPVKKEWAPGVDVALSVVQAATAGQKHAANRAWGIVPLRAATRDSAVDVKVTATVTCAQNGGSDLVAHVDARGQENTRATHAAVTVVDEGINILTDEKVPDPFGWFGETRCALHPFHDLYNYLLPIVDDRLKRTGVKTGGGADGDLFRRISPSPSRRFKPLSRWVVDVPLKDGCADVPFKLPEFVGEVRVTAVAYNKRATGAGAVQAKVVPNLVMQPDAPRFAAPGDVFNATITLSNRSGKEGVATYDLLVGGAASLVKPVHGEVKLADGATETITVPVTASASAGQSQLTFVSEGFGEKHTDTIELPVRPAAPWVKAALTVCLQPGESRTFPNTAACLPEAATRTFVPAASALGELAAALEYLVRYPYGCLEQTTSQMFPLVAAGGILNMLPVSETSVAQDAKKTVEGGVQRVTSMIRSNDFSMWPDCNNAPWDRSVSLWAAHFLVEADKAGFSVAAGPLNRVRGFLRTWAMSTNEVTSVYACHTLALAGTPDTDRMLHWFDRRARLSTLDRARLARAFVATGDRARAVELMTATTPENVRSAAFAVLALLDLDPKDARLPSLVVWLTQRRDKSSCHWGTTSDNAHALLALGAWYRRQGAASGAPELVLSVNGQEEPLSMKRAKRIIGGGDVVVSNRGKGAAYLTASCLGLPDPVQLGETSNGIRIARKFYLADGTEADLDKLSRGDLVIVELTLGDAQKRIYSDLVVEELLPACFEPDATKVGPSTHPWISGEAQLDWEMRREMRDDRMLFFSKRFQDAAPGEKRQARAYYAVRVVSAGTFTLPGPSVEAMYNPEIHARGAARRLTIAK